MFIRLLVLASLLLAGCLRTREDVKEIETAHVMREQVSTLQKTHADNNTRMDELLEQNRTLTGRIEELEYLIKKSEADRGAGKENLEKNVEESKRQNELLQESVVKLESQLQALQEEILALRARESAKPSKKEEVREIEKMADGSKGKEKAKDKDLALFDAGQNSFQEKKWKEAILNYDQYREKNPKGKHAAEATYKTGVCFQELGMHDEAKVFYQDVLAKFPQSDMAKKAQIRLKSLK